MHQTAALCASWRRVLGLFCAFLRYTLLSYPLPCGLSRIFIANFVRLGHTGLWQRGRAGEDTRPYENTGSCLVNAVGAGPRPARQSRIMFGVRRRGQAPALQKTDVQKSGRKPFKTGGPVCRPYGGERTGSVGSATPGAGAGPQQRKFLQGQGPVARREFETPLRFCAPGLFCLTQGVTLVMGVRG